MAVALWWKERLEEKCPLYDPLLRIEGYNYKVRRDELQSRWWKAVARRALWADYQIWFDKVYLAPYELVSIKPTPAKELEFWMTLAPMLYVNGRKASIRNHLVRENTNYQGRIVLVKVRRYFVHLGTWEQHADALLTNNNIDVRKLGTTRYT